MGADGQSAIQSSGDSLEVTTSSGALKLSAPGGVVLMSSIAQSAVIGDECTPRGAFSFVRAATADGADMVVVCAKATGAAEVPRWTQVL